MQLLSPNPIVVEFLQPVSFAVLVAVMSNGISNGINKYVVRLPTRRLVFTDHLENSSQIFLLDLGDARPETAGEYLIRKYTKLFTIANIKTFLF